MGSSSILKSRLSKKKPRKIKMGFTQGVWFREIIGAFFVFHVLNSALAANPLVADVGMADSHVHVFNGVYYMYSEFKCDHTPIPD